ncbi:MAG: transporter [Flavisolibacter sp.]
MKKVAIALLFFGPAVYAQQTGRIDTDRPDQTESAFLVPKKFFQAELGLLKETDADKNYVITHPSALLKYGLSDRVELRLQATPQTTYQHGVPQTRSEFALPPVELGTKLRLWEEQGLLPKTSVIVHFGLPFIASDSFRNKPVYFAARLTFQNSITENFGIGYNLGVHTGRGEATHFFYSLAPGLDIGRRWYAYLESFGSLYRNYAEHFADAGLAYYLTDNSKVDISAGTQVGSAEKAHYVALGFSFRLPPTAQKKASR